MSRGKQATAASNRRATQAEDSATHWRSRCLSVEADLRGLRRGAVVLAKQHEDLTAEVERLRADIAAGTSEDVRRLEQYVAEVREQLDSKEAARDRVSRFALTALRKVPHDVKIMPADDELAELSWAMGFDSPRAMMDKLWKNSGLTNDMSQKSGDGHAPSLRKQGLRR